MQVGQRLVGGDGHHDLEAVAEQAIGEVEQPGQLLAGSLLGPGPHQLVAVLQDDELPLPPPGRGPDPGLLAGVGARVPPGAVVGTIVVLAHGHLQQVAGLVEQALGVEDALHAAPLPPPVGQGPKGGGLARAGRAVEEQQPARHRGRVDGHETVHGGGHRRGVVAADLGPLRRATRSVQPSPTARPQRTRVPTT